MNAIRSVTLTSLQRDILNSYQHGFPVVSKPYEVIAEQVGATSKEVLAALGDLQEKNVLSRIGAVYKTGHVGSSSLAAMAVPEDQLESVAAKVNSFAEVNHNYKREHRLNLWFVVTAPDTDRLDLVFEELETLAGFEIVRLPMVEAFHLDLGFKLHDV